MKDIALVLPYYGKLPPYFNFFLRSLEGKRLDVLFFSDLVVEKYPANFKPIKMSLDEFKTLTERKLGVSVRIESSRRLCDFKPMYGKIFEDYLKGYDYWAFGDCDLVYGEKFNEDLADALSEDCDLFSLQDCFCSGPFCMIKNENRMNCLFAVADNLQEVFEVAGEQCVAFDELHGDWHDEVRSGRLTLADCRCRADSFSSIVSRTTGLKLRLRKIICEEIPARGKRVHMSKDGRLYQGDMEVSVFHYVRAKIRKYFTFVDLDCDAISDYIIDDAGFYVTLTQQRFRFLLNLHRKCKAMVRSLRTNGMKRIFGMHKGGRRWSR